MCHRWRLELYAIATLMVVAIDRVPRPVMLVNDPALRSALTIFEDEKRPAAERWGR